MKKLIIAAVVVIVLSIGGIFVMNKSNEPKIDIYDVIPGSTSMVMDDNEYLLYFTSKDCGYCVEIEGKIGNAYTKLQEEMPFYLVDMKNKETRDKFQQEENYDNAMVEISEVPEDFDINKFYSVGTPELVHIKDGKIVEIKVGSTDVLEYLDTLESK